MANEPMAAAAGAGTPPVGGSGPEPRTVAAERGASWWSEGWRLFTPGVGMWILAVVILVVVNIGLNFIPVVGPLASQILFPVFAGGLMLGCRAVDRGNPITLAHVFAGFSQRTGPLLVVGVIYTVLVIAVVVVVAVLLFLFFGAAVIGAIAAAGDPSRLGFTLESMYLAMLVGALLFLALYLPVIMAVWFAPALVMLGGAEPLAAMKLVQRLPEEHRAFPGLRPHRHPVRHRRVDPTGSRVAGTRAGLGRHHLRELLRHLRGQGRVDASLGSTPGETASLPAPQGQFSGGCPVMPLRIRAASAGGALRRTNKRSCAVSPARSNSYDSRRCCTVAP
jgi:hypothetical protein